jgi:signal recognition particle GTPase
LLVEYKEGFMAKREVEFVLHSNQSKTEVSIKWDSPSNDEGKSSDHDNDFGDEAEIVMSVFSSLMGGRKSKHNPQQLIEELKHRLGAAEVSAPIESNITKEIIKEKEVIVKIRCAYCRNLFNETLNKCPTCGAAV